MPHPKAGAFLIGGKGPTESELAAQRRATVTAAEIGEVPPPPPPPPPPLFRDVSRLLDDALTGVLQPSVPQPKEGRPQMFDG